MTQVQLHTAEELFDLGSGAPFILIDGRLVDEMSASPRSSRIAADLLISLGIFVRPRRLGSLYGADAGFILTRTPDSVVSPDVAFVRAERLPASDVTYLPLAPDLAVEVLSPTDRPGATQEKLALYQRAGVPLVWVVDPEQRTVAVHEAGAEARVLRGDDALDGGVVLPGFSLRVSELFG